MVWPFVEIENGRRSWLPEEGNQSPVWNVLFESIQGETLSWQLDIPAWSSGKRSEVEI